jgi:hypothetical protein
VLHPNRSARCRCAHPLTDHGPEGCFAPEVKRRSQFCPCMATAPGLSVAHIVALRERMRVALAEAI